MILASNNFQDEQLLSTKYFPVCAWQSVSTRFTRARPLQKGMLGAEFIFLFNYSRNGRGQDFLTVIIFSSKMAKHQLLA